MIHRLRDGAGIFHDEPEDLASALEARGLKLIELGRSGHPIGVLPYLEEEAIARLRNEVGSILADEAQRKKDNWDFWHRRWVYEANCFLQTSMQGPLNATVAYAAAETIQRAFELRRSMQQGHAEKAAALAMLVASWVFVGGVSVRLADAEPAAAKHTAYRKGQQTKSTKERATIKGDGGGLRKRDLVDLALKRAGKEAGTSDVLPHLFAALDELGMAPCEVGAKTETEIHASDASGKSVIFTFKGVQRMLAKLRAGTVPKRGRPTKKPA